MRIILLFQKFIKGWIGFHQRQSWIFKSVLCQEQTVEPSDGSDPNSEHPGK